MPSIPFPYLQDTPLDRLGAADQGCHTATMRSAVLVIAGALTVPLIGCASTINPEDAAESVANIVSQQAKFTPTDITCPSGVPAQAGVEFDCAFTGPEGKEYTAHVRVTEVRDGEAEFYVVSGPR